MELCAALVDVPSVSGTEEELADALERALREQAPHLEVLRSGDAVLARTRLGRERRVLLAGHLDTVPIADNLPSRRDGHLLYGCGTSDMKAGDAVIAHLAATVPEPALRPDAGVLRLRGGGGRPQRAGPDRARARRLAARRPGHARRADQRRGRGRLPGHAPGGDHHPRAAGALGPVLVGENAVHAAGPVLDRLAGYQARQVEIDGCRYREGLQAVRIAGGVAGNVVPDVCVVTVNFRFAPDRDVGGGASSTCARCSTGSSWRSPTPRRGRCPASAPRWPASSWPPPARSRPAKYGWTDVARFAALGIPALNFGPGDPNLAHTREEHVDIRQITAAADAAAPLPDRADRDLSRRVLNGCTGPAVGMPGNCRLLTTPARTGC